MKISSVFFTNLVRGVVAIAIAITLVTSLVGTAFADQILFDGFGTSTSTSDDVSGWRESEHPNDNDDDVVAKASSNTSSNSDYKSPEGGRFAKIKGDGSNDGEWMCRKVNASSYENLVLKYYWRGSGEAENDDFGVVEYRPNQTDDSACNSNVSGGWVNIASHPLDNSSSSSSNSQEPWSSLQDVDLPSSLSGTSFLIRFRNDSSQSDEYFRVDGVEINGDLPDTTNPTVTINQDVSQSDPTDSTPIHFKVQFSESVTGFTASDVIVSGTAGGSNVSVTGSGSTYNVYVNDVAGNGTVIATIPQGAAKDASDNESNASTSTDNQVTYYLNTLPIASNDSVTTSVNTPKNITLLATDADGNPLTYTYAQPSHGEVTGTGPNVTYTPNNNFADSDSFTFYVNDGYGNSNTATISILVTPVCDNDEHLVENTCVPNDDEDNDECDDGYYWNSEECVPEGEQCNESASFTVLSNANEEVDGGPVLSVETWEHPAWLDESGDGAKWIWSDAEVVNPSVDETHTFTDTFTIVGTATGGTLSIAADNGYTVTLNGNAVCSAPAESSNYGAYQVCNVDASLFVNGENTLSVEVKNLAYDTQDPHTNPAGVIYKLEVNENECDVPKHNSCVPGKELLVNGDFEDTPAVGGAGWNVFGSNLIDWLAAWINPTGAPEVANLEIQKEGLNGWLASDLGDVGGTQWTELDSDWFGPSNPGAGGGAVSISQVIDTVPGETYTVSFDFSPRPGTASGQNKVEVLANNVIIGSASASDPVSATLTVWSRHSFSFEADSYETTIALRDAGTPNDSLGTFVDNVSAVCEEPEPTATLVATKVVCESEAYLPNWGEGQYGPITSSTAQDFVNAQNSQAEREVCWIEPDWQFEWVTQSDSNENPGDNLVTPAGAPWTLFGEGVGDGSLTTSIPVGELVWVREVLKPSYTFFSSWLSGSEEPVDDVSAEIYCSTDVLNYDNWDWINPVEADETYYCVAFNAPTEGGEQCNPEASNVLLSSDDDGEDLLTQDENGPASLVALPHANWYVPSEGLWIWKDVSTSPEDANVGTTETFTREFEIVGTPYDSTLTLSADNGYEVRVNGNLVCADAGEHNYENTVDCAVPASYLQNGTNTVTFEVVNIDHETANEPSNNPAGLYYKLVVNENECVIPEEPTSTVTMCKTDENGYALSGWSLYLAGTHIEDLAVPTNTSAGINSTALEDGFSYLALASGTWANQNGANIVDAEYSTTDGWSTPMDGYTGYQTDILELQISSAFDPNSNWGPYSSAHEYAQSFVQSGNGSANFRIFDGTGTTPDAGWYGDNSGSLNVALYKGYAGVTGKDGCVTFEDVPYGSYTAGEIMQDGWSHYATWDSESVVDDGAVVVNGESEYFTIQNRQRDGEYEGGGEGTLVIKKLTTYAENGEFDFDIGGNESFYDADVLVNNGTGETSLELPSGTYSLTETQQEDWEFTSVDCEYEGESEGVEIAYGKQITIHDGETVTCTFRNAYDEDSGGSSGNQAGNNGPEVLGASTVVSEEQACGPLLNTYLRLGGANDTDEVTKLQDFLNEEMGSGLPLTGIFGPSTDAAVRAFQIKYWEEVLKPWFGIEGSAIQDQDDSTGYVYKTTRWKINNLWCPGSEALPAIP